MKVPRKKTTHEAEKGFERRGSLNKLKDILTFIDFTRIQNVTAVKSEKLQKDCRKICTGAKKAVILQPQSGNDEGTAMKARRSEDGCEAKENNDMMPQDKQRMPLRRH